MRYPDEKLSDEDELEGGGLADLVGPRRETCLKDSERGAEGSMSERATKKKGARKTSPPDQPRGEEKKAVKHKKGQGNEPKPMTMGHPWRRNRRGRERRRRKGRQRQTQMNQSQRRKRPRGPHSPPLGGHLMQSHCQCQECHQELPRWP